MVDLIHPEHIIKTYILSKELHKKELDHIGNPTKKRKFSTHAIGIKYSDDIVGNDINTTNEQQQQQQKKTEEFRIRLYAYCKDCEQVKGYYPDKQKTEDDVFDLKSGKRKRSRDGKIIKQYSSLGFQRGKTPDTMPLEQIDLKTFPKRICNACRFKKTSSGRANPYRQLLQSGTMNRVVSVNLQKKEVVSDPEKFHRPHMICGLTVPDTSKIISKIDKPIHIMTDRRMYSPGEMVTGLPIQDKIKEKRICDTMINGWMSDYCIINNCTRKAIQYGYCKICWSKNNKKCF